MPPAFGLLLFFLDFDDFLAAIVSAFGADGMWQSHFPAVFALHKVGAGQRVMGTAAITAAGSMFTLGMWGHVLLLFSLIN